MIEIIKHVLCLFVILLCLAISSFSQQTFLDSLIHATEVQQDDTNKIKNLLLISRKYVQINKERSLAFCDQAEKLSWKLNFGKGIAGAWFERSIIYMKTGSLDTAILYNYKSIRINDSLHIEGQLAHNYNLMGILLLEKTEIDQALEYFNNANYLFHRVKDSTGIIFINNSLGGLHETIGNYDSAAFYFFTFIKLCEKTGNEQHLGAGLVNLSNVYMLLENYDKAKEYAIESLVYSQKYDRFDHEVKAYKYLGIINTKKLNFNEADRYFKLGIELALKINDQSELASLYINFGNLYDDQEQFNNALIYYDKATQLAQITNNTEIFANSIINKGLIYERKDNPDKALVFYDSAVNILEGSGNYLELSSVYYNIYKIYETKKDYKNAFFYQSNYHSLKDSALNIASKKTIADLTLKYEKEKDQAKILMLENKNLQQDLTIRKSTNQKNIIFFSALGVIIIVLFTFFYNRQRARKDKIIAEQKIKQLEEETKHLAARSIVNGQEEERKRIAKELHDGLGVLLSAAKMQFSSIKDKSPENKPLIEKATKLLEQATGDVRRISHNMMPGLLTKFGLYEAVEDLFEQINDSKGPRAEVQIEGQTARLPENMEIMLYRIVQEMVNNTLKYAEANNISLIIKVMQDQLFLQFSDDGKGFNVQEKEVSKTLGLANIFSRVAFLNGNISVESKPGKGCTFFIQIPQTHG